jgi:hypothetical protein
MNRSLARMLIAAGVMFGGFVFVSDSALAMPGLDPGVSTAANAGAKVEQAGWVCGPYRCWWRPNYWGGRPGWGPRPGWGWRRGWGWRGRRW